MRFSIFAISTLSVFAAAAPAVDNNALAERASGSPLQDLMTGLTDNVRGLTSHINSVTSRLPANANAVQKKAATDSAINDIKGITQAFHVANTQIAAALKQQSGISARQGAPNLGDLPEDILGTLDGRPIDAARLLLTLVQELNPALKSALMTLSLGEVYVALQPLLQTELPTLVVQLGGLVNGLLAALAPLLSGLGGLLGPLLLSLGL